MSEIETAEDLLFFKLKDLITEQSEGEWTDQQIITDAHHFANHLRPLLAARPVSHGEGFSALQASPSVPTEGHDTAFIGHDEPIGEGGQFAYRTTLFGERHVVHRETGFVWFKLPYDYRYTDNASQRSNAETMLAALLATGAST
jgi:hypothetical protein